MKRMLWMGVPEALRMVLKLVLLTAVSKPCRIQWLNSMSLSPVPMLIQEGFAFLPSKVMFLKVNPEQLFRETTGPEEGRNMTLSALPEMDPMVMRYLLPVLKLLKLSFSV